MLLRQFCGLFFGVHITVSCSEALELRRFDSGDGPTGDACSRYGTQDVLDTICRTPAV
jgi:hypothetical protein